MQFASGGEGLHEVDGGVDGGGVVACEEELDFGHCLWGEAEVCAAGEEVVDDAVVGVVGILLCVVDALAGVGVDVGATDELDGEGPAFAVGEGELGLEF